MLTLTSSTGPGTIKVSESPRSLIFIGPLGLSVDQQSFLSHPRLLDLGESENWRDKDDSRDRNNCMMMAHQDSRVEVFRRSPRYLQFSLGKQKLSLVQERDQNPIIE